MDVIALRAGPLSAGIAPAAGGAITHLRSRAGASEIDWLRPWQDRGRGALDSACFVCVPFFSWLESDHFELDGLAVDLPPSGMGFDRCLHGLGWTAPWTVEEAGAAHAVLTHRNPGGAWPWAYLATQTVALREGALEIEVELRNESESDMPAGIGIHPFFPWPAGLRVRASTRALHVMSAAGLPCAADPNHPAVLALRAGDELPAGLDNIFEGWDGHATLTTPHGELSLTADPGLGFLCVYSAAPGRDFACIEPVSHTSNAIHRPVVPWGETGARRLAPGESMRVSTSLRPEPRS